MLVPCKFTDYFKEIHKFRIELKNKTVMEIFCRDEQVVELEGYILGSALLETEIQIETNPDVAKHLQESSRPLTHCR